MIRLLPFPLLGRESSPEIPLSESGVIAGLDHLPPRLLRILPRLALFEGVPPRDLRRILGEFEWFSLPGGWPLMRRGQEGTSLYVVTAGTLGLFVPGPNGEDYMAGQVSPGNTVGEPSLLTGEPRIATLIALRDSELLRLTEPVFDRLVKRHPVVMRNLAKQLVHRLKDMTEGRGDPERGPGLPVTIAVLPAMASIPAARVARDLAAGLKRLGSTVRLLDANDLDRSSDWFHDLETENDHVVYLGEPGDSAWTRLCLRQADRVLVLGDATISPPGDLPIDGALRRYVRTKTELVVLHARDAATGRGSSQWRSRFAAQVHHNLRLDRAEDVHRLARHLAGHTIALVLAGGGARGFAHLGVLRALDEAGIVIDRLGGTSMGAIVAAGVALEWTREEQLGRMYDSFVRSNPLSDVTLPLISLVRGRKVTRLLRTHFGEARIEEAWRPYFCVSSNLTTGREHVHRDGLFWKALRASVAIPGILPPVIRGGEVLVDGAVINNFPADVMDAQGCGPIIGVDVESHDHFGLDGNRRGERPFWGVLGDNLSGGPGIISLLIRSGTVNSEAQTRQSRAKVDLLFEPDLTGISVAHWKSFDQAVEAGYRSAVSVLERTDLSVALPVRNFPGQRRRGHGPGKSAATMPVMGAPR